MKLVEKLEQTQGPFYTFEFFPPRTDQGFSNLLLRISRLADLNPLAINITWGAGGSTKDRTLELASLTQRDYGIETVMHLTCTNMVQGSVDDALRAAKEIGIQNILALRGDPPRGEEYWIPTDPRFTHALDLISYIRSSPEFSDAFSLGVAAYPDGHTDSSYTEDEEIEHLKAKINNGADFIVTQLFYDTENFLRWLQKIRSRGITVPVIPGIMPLQTYASFLRLTKLCGTHIPDSIRADLEPIKHDDQKVKDYGIYLAVNMIQRLVDEGGLRGFHFCTLNLEKSVQRILEILGWTSRHAKIQNKLIAESLGPAEQPVTTNPDLIVTPASATSSATNGLVSHIPNEGDTGKGEVNYAATWDEFPNGRFGDVNSPAFGSQDLWGGFNRITPTGSHPNTLEDITTLSLRFLSGEITSYPFSPIPLSNESQLILPHLLRLARQGWWPVGSQPAIDGWRSDNDTVGWGPAGGYVYQKPFVEFFASKKIVEKLEEVIGKVKGIVDFLAGNNAGELRTSVQESERNAVTWGVFPGQEIIQSTIIEQESFLTWKDEVFSIWTDWASQFAPNSQERRVLEDTRDTRWLVNVTHHDFRDPDALWRFLFDEIGLDDPNLT
ncbi:methylenetetrahydrofolate reduct [Multifurca ochricompacta]|uniref:Methylenetetrahydrofolate reduct n=1 Tax=Multifurca ochricompacta TaxID=376703 RepID=A0AAD4MBZ9_9AGAM|nr:methylenetetrahydrofolate reduct [Multifurca ochricompacta]